MIWFKHDTNASTDAKLQTLMLDYGATGYGLYWYCVELIAQGVSENNITFELEHDARIIARNLNLTVQETTDMMTYMIKLGLFSLSNEKLACYALAKRLDRSMTSNPNMRDIIAQIREKTDGVSKNVDAVSKKVELEEKRREEKRRDKNRIEENSEAFKIASYLLNKILSKKPNFKRPNLNQWAKDIDLAIRLDKRSDQELINAIDWVYSSKKGEFWIPNILSAKKLREKYDTLEAQAMSDSSNSNVDKVLEANKMGISISDLDERGLL